MRKKQRQDREQEEWQEEAEELTREEVVSEPGNDKATSSERPRYNRLQEEIAALRRSPLHWAKFEYLSEQVSFLGFEKDGKTMLDESQCVRLAASDTTSLEMLKERHTQVLQMWNQGRCYSPLGLFYTSVRDNYDPRSEGTVSEELELEQVVRCATRLMQHQSEHRNEEGSSDGEVASSSASGEDNCSEDERASSKNTYPITKPFSSMRTSSSGASSTNAPTSQFSFRRPDYTSQSRQSYYRSNHPSRYASRRRSNRLGWQSSVYDSYRPSYQPWTSSKSAEAEDVEEISAYTEEEEEAFTA